MCFLSTQVTPSIGQCRNTMEMMMPPERVYTTRSTTRHVQPRWSGPNSFSSMSAALRHRRTAAMRFRAYSRFRKRGLASMASATRGPVLPEGFIVLRGACDHNDGGLLPWQYGEKASFSAPVLHAASLMSSWQILAGGIACPSAQGGQSSTIESKLAAAGSA